MNQTENSQPFSIPGTFRCYSAEETFELGWKLGSLLGKGSVVALRGPLGAGKTCFTKGTARALGVTGEITSPTYPVISGYQAVLSGAGRADTPGPAAFYHIDAYRLNGDDDFSAIGGEETVYGGGIAVIEWSERIPGFIPEDAFHVDIEIMKDGGRLISIYKGRGGA